MCIRDRPIIFFGASMIRAIPQPVIAGLLIATAFSMLKPQAIRSMLGAGRETRGLFLITTGATLLLSFHEAILLGAGLGTALFLVQASQPRLRYLPVSRDGWLGGERRDDTEHYVVQISGNLYFAAARQLPERLEAALPTGTQRLTLDLQHAHQSRVTAIQSLQRFVESARAKGIEVDICGQSDSLKLSLIHISEPTRPY